MRGELKKDREKKGILVGEQERRGQRAVCVCVEGGLVIAFVCK